MGIRDGVSEQTLLIKLSEECSELSAACMKLACIHQGDFPVRVGKVEAIDHILEEIADVSLAVLGISDLPWYNENTIDRYLSYKKRRNDES